MKLLHTMRSSLHNEKGAALLTVFVVIMVLLTLGMGLLSITYGSAQQAKVNDVYEKAYYVAEGGAKQGIEYLKYSVSNIYTVIKQDVTNAGTAETASNNYVSFFNELNTKMGLFTRNSLDTTSQSGITDLTVTIGDITNTGDKRVYNVVSTAKTGTAVTRTVVATLSVTFKKVERTGSTYTPLPGNAVMTGGKWDSAGGNVKITNDTSARGSAQFGASPYNEMNVYSDASGNFKFQNSNLVIDGTTYHADGNQWWPPVLPAATLFDPSMASRFSWKMKYPGFSKEAVTSVTPSLGRLINDGETINKSSFNGAPYNGNAPSPLYLTGQSNASFKVDSDNFSGFTYGQIVSTGKLTLSGPATGSSSNYVKLYSNELQQTSGTLNYVKVFADGDATFSNGPGITNSYIYSKGNVTFGGRTLNNLTIICDGNLTISGGSSTNLTIYCKGTIDDKSNTRTNVLIYCDRYLMSGGSIQGDSIVYAQSYMKLESTINGLFYTRGDINLTSGGSGVTGQMAALGNITTTGYSFTYDNTLLDRLNVNPFVSSAPSEDSVKIVQPLNSDIYTTPLTIGES